MKAYFDTSAILKVVLSEAGTDVAEAVWDASQRRVTTVAAYAEARAAISAGVRTRRLSARDGRRARAALDARFLDLTTLDLDLPLAHAAGEQTEHHALRGYDAVHLATALVVDDGETVFVTWDGDLGRAAVEAGFTLVPA